jgi:predicted RecA/RadA family phage recombinase
MATARLLQNAGVYDWTNSGSDTLPSGTVVVNGWLVGVLVRATEAGKLGAVQMEGIFEFPIASATTANLGAKAYWNATDGVVTTSSSGNTFMGYFVTASVSGETTCKIMLAR